MARQSSSGRWSRSATGKQIAALKSHGNYDGKYYSMGRASQTIGRSIGSGSGAGPRPGSGGGGGEKYSYPSSVTSAYLPASFLAQLLGVPDDLDTLLSVARSLSPSPTPRDNDDAVESVVFTVSSDESDPAESRIVFEATVVRDSSFAGEPSLEVRFASNVEFGEAPPNLTKGFASGVTFDD